MFEEDDEDNVYVSVSYPNLNFNISEPLTIGSRVNAQQRFYSVSMSEDIEVGIWKWKPLNQFDPDEPAVLIHNSSSSGRSRPSDKGGEREGGEVIQTLR